MHTDKALPRILARITLFSILPSAISNAGTGVSGDPYTTDGTLNEVNYTRLTTDDTYNLVTGSGSYTYSDGELAVGNTANGTYLTVSNGGTVSAEYNASYSTSGSVRIGYGSTSDNSQGCDNSVTITGLGSTVYAVYSVTSVGYYGSGNNLLIEDGGKLQISTGSGAQMYVGGGNSANTNFGNNNNVTVTGSTSVLSVTNGSSTGGIVVGNFGCNNSMTVSGGATVTSNIGTIGLGGSNSNSVGIGGTNHVTVTGSGSSWTISSPLTTNNNYGALYVGKFGSSNYLSVLDGADVSCRNLYIGGNYLVNYTFALGSNNYVELNGAGSTLTVSSLFQIGSTTTGTGGGPNSGNHIDIINGALVKVGSSTNVATVNVVTGNSVRLNDGYLAIYGDQTSTISSLVTAGSIYYWDNGTSGWVEASTTDDLSIHFYDADDEALAFADTGYSGLAGYTVVTSIVPEPATFALFGGLGVMAFVVRRRIHK